MDQIWGQPAVIANLRKGKDKQYEKLIEPYSRAYCDEDIHDKIEGPGKGMREMEFYKSIRGNKCFFCI